MFGFSSQIDFIYALTANGLMAIDATYGIKPQNIVTMRPIHLNNIKQLFSGTLSTIAIDQDDRAYRLYEFTVVEHEMIDYRVKMAAVSRNTDSDTNGFTHYAMIATKIKSKPNND